MVFGIGRALLGRPGRPQAIEPAAAAPTPGQPVTAGFMGTVVQRVLARNRGTAIPRGPKKPTSAIEAQSQGHAAAAVAAARTRATFGGSY